MTHHPPTGSRLFTYAPPHIFGGKLPCRACHLDHSPLERCEIAINRDMANSNMANAGVANGSMANTYRYRNAERRKAYMRDYMRKKRAAG